MTLRDRWLLPEGVDEVLPPRAAALEQLCREVIDLYATWGYELVIPPLIEFLDSLLTGTGSDLDIQTFKLTDQLTGRLMGLRADTTPQVARIDAHKLKREIPTRLCYLGTVVHTRPMGTGDSRCPLQVGAELYGHSGVESDAEVLCLMLETLKLVGQQQVYVDLGHMGIVRAIVAAAGLDDDQTAVLFDVLQRKAAAELDELIASWQIDGDQAIAMRALIEMNGDAEVLQQARQAMAAGGAAVTAAIDELERLIEIVGSRYPDVNFYVDPAELRGYHYHTGLMFAAYLQGEGVGVAYGGRYDDIGKAFGRARPATGFSVDLKRLLALHDTAVRLSPGIAAPWSTDAALQALVADLRAQGERVVVQLPGTEATLAELGCDRCIVERDGQWQIVSA
ncbi:ATP phosphoribosyltransferase regulatory subunit [Methylohalomonas lacus]|uniref:ATP phosphoribosyltransferase regulatory subunit n=1 Tax=Methylohalomonas lacus TaxID=398773 RepID=A0AAE3L0Z1_9GAMM|nr:ATP phosphoribosyltransferase regulatory subunit [Methylohalomonas lacus]MCS3902396.1 ATP phosphoribosyltransferase regulatory subunit [Methylohalomonas lacus]